MRILDIDLDFFLNDKYRGSFIKAERLPANKFRPWSASDTEKYLEEHCGLIKTNKIPGKCFTNHDEVFYYLRDLQEQNNHKLMFHIDHLDAHADLGTGDISYRYIYTDLLNHPVKERAYPEKISGWEGLSAGNFLAFAVACRWIESLNYINNPEWVDDTLWFHFKNYNTKCNILQLKQFSCQQMEKVINCKIGMKQMIKSLTPINFEPEVPFMIIDSNEFINKEPYDLIFLTQSPGFTPEKSDELIPVIKQYFQLI